MTEFFQVTRPSLRHPGALPGGNGERKDEKEFKKDEPWVIMFISMSER